MIYDAASMEQLDMFQRTGDRTAYYRKLIALNDPYGKMGIGVVKQSNIAGVVARRYAMRVSERYCRPIDDRLWLEISEALMRADYDARRSDANFEAGTPSLRWNVIRDYHVGVFGDRGYPPETWTAWIPLKIDGEDKDRGLWNRMVTEDFLTVAVQTVWLVSGRMVHAENIQKPMTNHVVPQLQYNPPLAGDAPPDPATAACMARLAPYQLSGSDASDNERLASFYLAVLAKDPHLYLGVLAVAPTSAWRDRPHLINPAY